MIQLSELPDHFFAPGSSARDFTDDSYVVFRRSSDRASHLLDLKIAKLGNARSRLGLDIGAIGNPLRIYVRVQDAELSIGGNCSGFFDARLWRGSFLRIGDNNTSNSTRIIIDRDSMVKTGSDCMFSENVTIQCGDQHALISLDERIQFNLSGSRIELAEHCWLGRNSCIVASSKRVSIGKGVVVGIGAVVTRSVPACSIVASNPAKVIRSRIGWTREKEPTPNQIAKVCSEYLEQIENIGDA